MNYFGAGLAVWKHEPRRLNPLPMKALNLSSSRSGVNDGPDGANSVRVLFFMLAEASC